MSLDKSQNRFYGRKEEKNDVPREELLYPENFSIYYTHLDSLGLVTWPVYKQDPIVKDGIQTGIRRFSKLHLTEFGESFIKTCIPNDLDVQQKISAYRKRRNL